MEAIYQGEKKSEFEKSACSGAACFSSERTRDVKVGGSCKFVGAATFEGGIERRSRGG